MSLAKDLAVQIAKTRDVPDGYMQFCSMHKCFDVFDDAYQYSQKYPYLSIFSIVDGKVFSEHEPERPLYSNSEFEYFVGHEEWSALDVMQIPTREAKQRCEDLGLGWSAVRYGAIIRIASKLMDMGARGVKGADLHWLYEEVDFEGKSMQSLLEEWEEWNGRYKMITDSD